MNAPADTEDDRMPTDSGDTPADPPTNDAQADAARVGDEPREEDEGPERNPLREQMREADEAKLLTSRLAGQRLPEVELQTAQSGRDPLLSLLSGLAVIYFVPGNKDQPYEDGFPTPDTAQHRGYVNRKADFDAMRVKIICVSSRPAGQLQQVGRYFVFLT